MTVVFVVARDVVVTFASFAVGDPPFALPPVRAVRPAVALVPAAALRGRRGLGLVLVTGRQHVSVKIVLVAVQQGLQLVPKLFAALLQNPLTSNPQILLVPAPPLHVEQVVSVSVAELVSGAQPIQLLVSHAPLSKVKVLPAHREQLLSLHPRATRNTVRLLVDALQLF